MGSQYYTTTIVLKVRIHVVCPAGFVREIHVVHVVVEFADDATAGVVHHVVHVVAAHAPAADVRGDDVHHVVHVVV